MDLYASRLVYRRTYAITRTLRVFWLRLHSMKRMCLFLGLLLGAIENPVVSAQSAGARPNAFAHSTQMMVVTTANWNAVDGKLQRYERGTAHQKWQRIGAPISVVVGSSGMGWGIGLLVTDSSAVRLASEPVKKEGDGRSPAGVFAIGTAFGFASRPLPTSRLPYLNLTPSIECVDDVGSKYYNHIVDRSTVAPDWNSSEHMLRVGEPYRWGIVVDQNGGVTRGNENPPVAGSGSCVFLHIWRGTGRGTAGCTAMPQDNLEALISWLDPARKPLLVQLPAMDYRRLSKLWRLPPL